MAAPSDPRSLGNCLCGKPKCQAGTMIEEKKMLTRTIVSLLTARAIAAGVRGSGAWDSACMSLEEMARVAGGFWAINVVGRKEDNRDFRFALWELRAKLAGRPTAASKSFVSFVDGGTAIALHRYNIEKRWANNFAKMDSNVSEGKKPCRAPQGACNFSRAFFRLVRGMPIETASSCRDQSHYHQSIVDWATAVSDGRAPWYFNSGCRKSSCTASPHGWDFDLGDLVENARAPRRGTLKNAKSKKKMDADAVATAALTLPSSPPLLPMPAPVPKLASASDLDTMLRSRLLEDADCLLPKDDDVTTVAAPTPSQPRKRLRDDDWVSGDAARARVELANTLLDLETLQLPPMVPPTMPISL